MTEAVAYPELHEMTRQYLDKHISAGMKAFKEGDIDTAVKAYDHSNKVLSFYMKKLSTEVFIEDRESVIMYCNAFGTLCDPLIALDFKTMPYRKPTKNRISKELFDAMGLDRIPPAT